MKRNLILSIIFLVGCLAILPEVRGAVPASKPKTQPREMPSIIDEINDGVNSVEMPAALVEFITTPPPKVEAKAAEPRKRPVDPRQGYRVKVYKGNNTSDRNNRMRQVSSMYPTYLAGKAPYFEVHAGNFRTQAEANAAAARIRQRFPAFAAEVRVVRSRINP